VVLIAQAIFLLEHGQTDRQIDALPTPAAIQPAWVIITKLTFNYSMYIYQLSQRE